MEIGHENEVTGSIHILDMLNKILELEIQHLAFERLVSALPAVVSVLEL